MPKSIVVIGGGPGGYEAALVAAQFGARVTVVESGGIGGAAVLTDCVPSKTLIATSERVGRANVSGELGVRVAGQVPGPGTVSVDFGLLNQRVLDLAQAQSEDIARRLREAGVEIVEGHGRLVGPAQVAVADKRLMADVILLATGARPRELPSAVPDGERILTWQQLYTLDALPERLIVVGSGVTGAEFAGAYTALGSEVVLVSSRERVLPTQDHDAAEVLEVVLQQRGMELAPQTRAQAVERTDEGVIVTLQDGSQLFGSHCLMAVGAVPNTSDLGCADAGVELDEAGYVKVDRVSRTNVNGIYAAGDCTGVMPLANVAAMQGRIAMWHALGEAVSPLNLKVVSSNVFTDPQIASVGVTQEDVDSGVARAHGIKLPLATNARAKMQGLEDGFVKIFCRVSGTVVGAVVVAPSASELIYPLALAVELGLNVDDLATTFTVYPSLSGSIAEAARRLHQVD
ncbi:MAG: NAD(P)H-quinone dehydrogenase [Actinobacteria bacterium]|jgi:dihydrolipoamide dehydrogenase|nr:NAD(P)H-quinone dehydrogenase [Actinomycetota bacterium]MCO5298455.1 NAD(P)H-quinone dehydrogenase [Candidatus Nanopelagicales bacterium]MCB9427419.1 NAD(P)H-quinone dehydrogenase [Actinomycetota bacterium]HPE13833.1 NAD(P)H-quinone dehydrogenase [Actinomycetota bacterium]HPQ84811.1 NAD(P)H-quinone dehydrogenase [Actinomycetota bacterium]